MKKKVFGLALSLILVMEIVVPTWATTISGVRNQRSQTQQSLNEVNGQISDIQTQRDAVYSELETMNDQLVEVLTSIEILEEEISLKQKEIDKAKKDLEEAQKVETEQYESMKKRIQFMYEQGNMVYMQALLGAVNYSDMVNKAEYVEGIYNYDRQLLAEYVGTREGIETLKSTLEEEQSQMRTAEYELEGEKENLEMLVALKRRTVEDFDAQLEKAKEKASAYKRQLQQQTERIRKLEERERKKKEEEEKKKREEEEAAQGSDEDGDGTTSIDVNTGETEGDDVEDGGDDGGDDDYSDDVGSSLGQQICDYACQFVGNPYVYGGTSLTDGADCSGFTQAVYAHFGISIPRDSYSQRSCGYGVSYEEAQPGDIICYAGHVAIYLGDGQIVHASTEQTGITYGYATYRTILAVRRVI
jgi:cell wall-associated NlpC family hydrolase